MGFTGYQNAYPAQIWMGGLDPVVRRAAEPDAQSDFLDLFDPGARWPTAARELQVLQITSQFVLKGSREELTKTFEGLRARNISLAVAVGFLYGGGHCGRGVEGFFHQHTARLVATRIKDLGGRLDYAVMDEPLYYGHFFKGPTACNAEISDIVREVAEGVQELRAVFPDVRVGDVEPVGVPSPEWVEQIGQFADAYRSATGTPLAFFRADISWPHESWRAQLRAAADLARARAIQLGVIINSGRRVSTGIEWTEGTRQSLSAVQEALGSLPEQVVFQSWWAIPHRFLPDDQPGTLTYAVAQYAKRHRSDVNQDRSAGSTK
jgi:hypothetical protein